MKNCDGKCWLEMNFFLQKSNFTCILIFYVSYHLLYIALFPVKAFPPKQIAYKQCLFNLHVFHGLAYSIFNSCL